MKNLKRRKKITTLFRKKPKFTYTNIEVDRKILEKFNKKHNIETKKENKICIKCNKPIPDESFHRAHHLFSHSYYDCHINQKMATYTKDGPYHWDCYVTTEEGKKFKKQLIENEKFKIIPKTNKR